MANEYKRLDGAGVGIKRGEEELTITMTNMNAAGAVTLGTGVVLGVIVLATASESDVMQAMEHAKRRLIRYFATNTL